MTFGVAASPYLAVKCLQHTAQDFGAAFPRASLHVQSSFYVDDCLAGASTPQEALALFTELRKLPGCEMSAADCSGLRRCIP